MVDPARSEELARTLLEIGVEVTVLPAPKRVEGACE
jgi:hypothetical protein